MESINLDDLAGFQEDAQARRDFERPYFLPSFSGFLMALVALPLMFGEMGADPYGAKQRSFLSSVWFQCDATARQFAAFKNIHGWLPGILFGLGFLIFMVTSSFLNRAVPVSRVSGQKLEKYWNAKPLLPGNREIVYVDRAARTYFIRVARNIGFRRNGAAPIPPF
jgi:hypothetical protein